MAMCSFCGKKKRCAMCARNNWLGGHCCEWCDAIIETPQNIKGRFVFCGPKGDSTCEWLFYEKYPNHTEQKVAA